MFATISPFPDFSVHKLIQSVQSHLRIFRNEHFLGFLDHGLWFELVLREAVFPWIEELSSGNAGQDQICRVRLEATFTSSPPGRSEKASRGRGRLWVLAGKNRAMYSRYNKTNRINLSLKLMI